MKHPGAVFLLLAPALLTACAERADYVPPQQGGQWAPGQWTPQQPQTYQPQPTYNQPGQWAPPAPMPAPAPWWQPQPGAFPFPFPFPTAQPQQPQGQTPQLPTFPGLPTIPTPFTLDLGQQCVNSVNEHRATQGLPALQRWAQTETCAASQARDGAATGQPHGAFGRCSEQGQNVCPAWPGPANQMIAPCIQSMWNEGPGADFAAHGHYLNLASARFTRVACGFYTAPSGQVSLVQDFL
jgi:cysteine-rich secretory family protein